jgi:hypothetical protein
MDNEGSSIAGFSSFFSVGTEGTSVEGFFTDCEGAGLTGNESSSAKSAFSCPV